MSARDPLPDRQVGDTDGPPRGFEPAFQRVAPALQAWAELRIRPSLRTHFEPQDLVQEVWLRGSAAFARHDENRTSFRAWIFRIGKNVLLEAARAERAGRASAATWSPTTKWNALQEVPQSVTSFTQRLAQDESVRAFVAHVSELDETDRMILIHCGLEEESCASAATKLALGAEAVSKRWQRLRANLRERTWARALLPDPAQDPRASDAS